VEFGHNAGYEKMIIDQYLALSPKRCKIEP